MHHPIKSSYAALFILASTFLFAGCDSSAEKSMDMNNKEIVRNAFERWSKAEGSFFDLLAEDVKWTITGNSPVSKTYTSKKQFLDEVINPLNEKLTKKIVPRLKELYADGDMVIALWDGSAVAKDGITYDNTYSWYMKMRENKIIEVVAFFDTIGFTELWKRVPAVAGN